MSGMKDLARWGSVINVTGYNERLVATRHGVSLVFEKRSRLGKPASGPR